MILCCGEMLIDMIPEQTVSGARGFVPHSGGAIFNTAVALGRLGQSVGMLSGTGTDLFGRQLTEDLEAANVDTSLLIVSDRPTTLAFVSLQDGHASYRFYDENSAGRMLTSRQLPDLPETVSALYFGGISLASEPGADAYAALLEAEGKTRPVMIDPNIRPSFIEDKARYLDRMMGMIAAADIVKVSDEDLDWIIPEPLPARDKALAILERGPALVILTRGSAGATAFLGNGVEAHVPSEKVEVRDTVGAGDTFNAGVLARLSDIGVLQKSDLRCLTAEAATEALQFGARVAAVTVSRAGANPPWADEV